MNILKTSCGILALAAFATSANAITFVFNSGGLTGTADVSFGAGTMSVTLTNTTPNPISIASLINGIQFNIAGVNINSAFADPASRTAPLGTATIAAGGAYAATVPNPSATLSRWDFSLTGSAFVFTGLSGGNPDTLIIGPDSTGDFNNATGGYTNANASIIGDNPQILSSLSATFNITGVTTQTTVSNVLMRWGTADATTPPNVPDGGATVVLLGVGLAALALVRRKMS